MANTIKLLSEGAEAKIYTDGSKIIKKRASKAYRHPQIDMQIITSRTGMEAKILERLSELEFVPKIVSVSQNIITLEKIQGLTLFEAIKKKKTSLEKSSKEVAKILFSLHNKGVVHGDVTPLNFIQSGKKLYVIDFGLSIISEREEDKAYDVAMCNDTFSAYPSFYQKLREEYLSLIEDTEKRKLFDERLSLIFSRGRNKGKNSK